MRDIDLGEDTAYLISDFPVTKEVLDRIAVKSISFLDDDLDRGGSFRAAGAADELRAAAAARRPGTLWGLVEIYDMRLRRFTREDEAVAWFLSARPAGESSRWEALGDSKRRLAAVSPALRGRDLACPTDGWSARRRRRRPIARQRGASDARHDERRPSCSTWVCRPGAARRTRRAITVSAATRGGASRSSRAAVPRPAKARARASRARRPEGRAPRATGRYSVGAARPRVQALVLGRSVERLSAVSLPRRRPRVRRARRSLLEHPDAWLAATGGVAGPSPPAPRPRGPAQPAARQGLAICRQCLLLRERLLEPHLDLRGGGLDPCARSPRCSARSPLALLRRLFVPLHRRPSQLDRAELARTGRCRAPRP